METSKAADVAGTPPRTAGNVVAQAAVNVGLPVSPAADLLIRRAAWIGQGSSESAMASFTSLFLAFLACDDELALWVQDKVTWIGPALGDVVRKWNHKHGPPGRDEARVRAARSRTDLVSGPPPCTASVDKVLAAARDLARRVGSDALDVRHLFAVYLYAPPGHGDDLNSWKLDREAWATRFRCYVTAAHPSEADGWRTLHDNGFPRRRSIGIRESLRWAAGLAETTSAATIDAAVLFRAILRDGVTHSTENVTSAQLVDLLGGVDAVEQLLGDAPASPGTASSTVPLGDDVDAVIDRALVFATATHESPQQDVEELHVRHVLLAMLSDRSVIPALGIVGRAGRTTDGVLAQLCTWIYRFRGSIDDLDRMHAVLDELREDVLAGYDNDEAAGEDRLNIGPDVRALAAVLASTQVKPPLSVGLFGDWGSGKSFFMAKLRERIDQLARAAKANAKATSWFCGQRGSVVQIDFNAWHYLDANLWSSLAVRVFDALSDEFNEEFARACLDKLESLKERETEITAERTSLDVADTALAQALATQHQLRMERKLGFEAYVQQLAARVAGEVAADPRVQTATAQLNLQGTAVHTDFRLAKADLETIAGRIKRWWQTLRSPARLATVGLVLGVPLAVEVGVAVYSNLAEAATAALVTLGATLTTAGGLVQRTAGRIQGLLGGALDEVDRIEAAARASKTAEERKVEAQRDEIGTRISVLEREQLALTKRKLELETQLALLRKGDKQSLKDFVLQRAASDDYRKQLGIVSAVHKDFGQLVRLLVPTEPPPNVDRIILYIDDLDRCPPKRVVEVLQAIHVILSLPLFVVVVGVDSRWLLDSLKTYYRSQFPSDATVVDAARPQQYLEKIFQIPFTLRPMSADGYDHLVGSLLSPHVDEARSSGGDDAGRRIARGSTSPEPPAARPAARASPRSEGRARIDLTPRGLRLEPRELAYVRTLSGLVPTPRAAKRFVNLYRIVRSTLDDVALDQLIDGRYKATQICLALVIGCPGFGAELFEQVLSRQLRSRDALVTWCATRATRSTIEPRERAALRELLARAPELEDWTAVEDAVRSVARFSFETGRVLGTYAIDPEPPKPAG